ncbi:MAG: alpha/beta hydrolase [Acinetobacter sp.]|uniref:alpha/beta hydrolase n=1 Tax=Acinetobacter sp. TaxID=472 RepID=UPI003D003103
MFALNESLKNFTEKGQGTAARLLDRLPNFAKESLAKRLDYPFIFPELDPLVKCMMAAQLKQGKSGFITLDYQQSRKQFELQMESIKSKPTAVKYVQDLRLPLQSGTVFARHYHPTPNKKLPMIVFYHGGGFVVGSLDTHDEVCRLLAVHAKVQVLSIDYPLSPEASPAQLIQSCEDALAWTYQNSRQLKILKNRIAVAGDSAGGNIATVVAQRSVKKAFAPQAQLLIYPVVDFKSRHPSFYAYKEGLVLTERDIDIVTELYPRTHNVALDDPLVSPTYGQFLGLAPTYLITAGHDVLHDEGEIYSHKLRQQGVKVFYQEYTDQTHGFINMTPVSHRAKKYVIEVSEKFRKFWDKHS